MKLLFFFLISVSVYAGDPVPLDLTRGTEGHKTIRRFKERGRYTPPPPVYGIKGLDLALISDINQENNDLKKVKYYLINGEINLAKVYLSQLIYRQSKLRPIIYRYLAILHFMTSDFHKTYEYLNQPELKNIPHFAKICTLKVLSEIVLNKKTELKSDWDRCQMENSAHFVEKNLIWIETLVQLRLKPQAGITKIPFKQFKLASLDNDELKIFLKLALYLNQESLVIDQLSELTIDQLKDSEIRELAGQIFFRKGQLAKSYRFIEDLKSPNSENIKGNLYLLRQKYEIAYAQFKLALEQKQNSQNAVERLLPLAWLLGDWEGGSKYAEKLIAPPKTQINKLTLSAAFLVQAGHYENANLMLKSIAERSQRGGELDITQLLSFTGLMLNRTEIVRKQAALSCEQYDLINCWVLFQLGQWDTFPLTIRREEKLPEKRDWETLIKEEIHQPLKETVYVNQIDIEEMDDKLIQLVPKQ
jgi:hypothetical protein